MRTGRKRDPTGRGDLLKSRHQVHPITIEITPLNDDIAEVDPDTQLEPHLARASRVGLGEATLNFHGAGHRVDHAGEFDQRAVAHQLDDPPAIPGDLRRENLAMELEQRLERASLVLAHQPGIARHVRRQDGREPAFLSGLTRRHRHDYPGSSGHSPLRPDKP